MYPGQSQEQTSYQQNDQNHHKPSPNLGFPHTLMHINGTSLLATIKTQTHFPIVLLRRIIKCLHGMHGLKPQFSMV